MHYAHEHDFDAIIDAAANDYNVPVALIKAVIMQESGFNPKAYRAEPQISDASRGLMQLLFGTAKTLGYTGTPDGLYDPTVSVRLGTKYLSDNINFSAAHGYALDSAISAYNGGFSSQRTGDGKRTGSTTDTPFINQDYVNVILKDASYFAQNAGAPLQAVNITAPAVVASGAPPGVPVPAVLIGVAILFPRALPAHR